MLLFDLDGTLVDSARDIALALTRISHARGGPTISPQQVRPLVSFGAERLVATALDQVAGEAAADLHAFRTILRDLPADPGALFPGVGATLATLAAQGFRLGIVTNKPEALAVTLLSGHRLGHLFDTVVGGDTTADAKPHPRPVHHALAEMGASAGSALFIGDSIVDAKAARAAAIPFILYEGGYGGALIARAEVAGRFSRFQDLPLIAAALLAPGRAWFPHPRSA
ncbi:HAD family hydrolase [uncultured Sphingomonas sp.]|uniref:HAD family hydrolase n=1 Tax=uncultured Sphingomonas sp. TaxID=158754 RepID=UPI0035C96D32